MQACWVLVGLSVRSVAMEWRRRRHMRRAVPLCRGGNGRGACGCIVGCAGRVTSVTKQARLIRTSTAREPKRFCQC